MAVKINQLNKVFDHRVRLGIMTMLQVESEVSFLELKEELDVTDGNLASHLKTLEDHKYIKVHKSFVGRKTHTTYSTTRAGSRAFGEHVRALETIIKNMK